MSPKLKTHKGASKRFKITASGKVKRRKACKSHLLTKKDAHRKRVLKKSTLCDESQRSSIKKLLPYG
jgi:large subunit ribosomal protein L35